MNGFEKHGIESLIGQLDQPIGLMQTDVWVMQYVFGQTYRHGACGVAGHLHPRMLS
jgi:hypothetical protein